MLKRELEWIGFVLFAAGIAWLLAFRGAARPFIDFSMGRTEVVISSGSFFILGAVALMIVNVLFAWMVHLARKDPGKSKFLKRFLGTVGLIAAGAGITMGIRALPAFTADGFEELANGSVAGAVLLFSVVLLAMFRARELPIPND